MSGGDWYVLVETGTGADGRQELRRAIHVEGGREQAVARAAELARTCAANGEDGPSSAGRRVFRISETSWLVEHLRSYWADGRARNYATPLRISVGELEYAKEVVPAEPPPKGVLRRALGRD